MKLQTCYCQNFKICFHLKRGLYDLQFFKQKSLEVLLHWLKGGETASVTVVTKIHFISFFHSMETYSSNVMEHQQEFPLPSGSVPCFDCMR